VCPAPDSANPLAPSPDAQCGAGATGEGSLPDVAVGASFSLQFNQTATGSPRPAVASLAQSTPEGWSLTQPGWLGFVAWSGSDVVDFTHIRGQAIASLRLEPDLTTPLPVGFLSDVAATPFGADETILGGAIACTFTSSDPGVVSLRGQSGRVAHIAALAAGDATLTASCMGAQTAVTLHVAPSPDADVDIEMSADAGADASAGASADADADAGGGD
jgi:hypothetical protein